MLAELKFCQGAVSNKSFIPALSHFAIDGGRVRGYNGVVALCCPIPLDLVCKPRGEAMVRAIGNCSDDTTTLALTPTGKLSIKSGSFRAFVECLPADEVTPHVEPEGEICEINGGALLEAMKVCEPFVGDDASRPFSNGILLKGRSAFATNNICAVEFWIGDHDFPHVVNIPLKCVREMTRIGEPPISAQFAPNSVTFHYSNERWVRTQLLSTEWPDISKILDRPSNPKEIDPALFPALEKVKHFLNKYGAVYFHDGHLSTEADHTESGASFDVPGLDYDGIYGHEYLLLLKDSAERIDWSTYPDPCMFFGPRLRGAIMGKRK